MPSSPFTSGSTPQAGFNVSLGNIGYRAPATWNTAYNTNTSFVKGSVMNQPNWKEQRAATNKGAQATRSQKNSGVARGSLADFIAGRPPAAAARRSRRSRRSRRTRRSRR